MILSKRENQTRNRKSTMTRRQRNLKAKEKSLFLLLFYCISYRHLFSLYIDPNYFIIFTI